MQSYSVLEQFVIHRLIIILCTLIYYVVYLNDVCVVSVFVWFTMLRVFEQNSTHVRAGVLEQLVGVVEYNQCDLTVTQNT